MISLIKGLKKENISILAELWEDEKFQKLVDLLRLNQENLAKKMLAGRMTQDNLVSYRELQDTAATFSLVIKTVEECFNKINKIRRKK
jgi:hypothetical protein